MKYMLPFTAVGLLMFAFAINGLAQTPKADPKGGTKISLTIGNKVIPAVLYDTAPAKDLMAKLPVTVSLNRGPVDYCGGISPIKYGQADVRKGYRNGDLAFWIPGRDFVIFTDKEESSANVSDIVILGRIQADIKEVRELGDVIKVTIALDK